MSTPETPSCPQTKRILDWINENFVNVLYPTGYADCILGVAERFGGPPVAVLDLEKMLTKLRQDGMTDEEALEYFEYNILGAYLGEETPVYMHIPDFKAT